MLISFHGRPELKTERLELVRKHIAADLLAQGATGKPSRGEKGCAVACTVDGYDHHSYPVELGVPVVWAFAEDTIFEGLSVAESRGWPEAFLVAIPVGVSLWPAYHRVAARILREVSLPSVPETDPSRERVVAAVLECARLFDEAAAGRIVSPTFWAWNGMHGKSPLEEWVLAQSAASDAHVKARGPARSAARSAVWVLNSNAVQLIAEEAVDSAAWKLVNKDGFEEGEALNRTWARVADIALEELAYSV